jgi:starch synthase (maltosyl-transferring)
MGAEFAASRRLEPARDTPDDFSQAVAEAPFDLTAVIMSANRSRHDDPVEDGEQRLLSAPGAPVVALLRTDAPDARFARRATLVLANVDPAHRRGITTDGLLGNAGGAFLPVMPGAAIELAPGEVRTESALAAAPIVRPEGDLAQSARSAANAPRIAIEAVAPAVDDGRFPARRVVGDVVQAEADIICEGHDVLGVVLLWRAEGAAAWQEQRMHPLGNDRFAASFPLLQIGRHEFTVEAWRDEFATWRSEVSKKHAAGVDVTLELEEGRLLVARTAKPGSATADALQALGARLEAAAPAERLTILLSDEVADLMTRADPRPFAVRVMPGYPIDSERSTARFASWYEIFPRSMSDDPRRHGTFQDVIRHLPRIRDMGFDVLYFPPIHPIGKTNRKGRNNSLTPGPDDPGSPYAIGADAGGHDAIHPELGTIEDFRALRAAAAGHGLELALDFAIQCSPDHPWLRDHHGWFDWRPDGSIRYAENPPKKYEDIVNVDFYTDDAVPGLWLALAEIVLFWASEGVRLFRVDNPHTKPLPFWEWLIATVQARYPDALFLAEAFTRPKVMYRLGKIGFSQSYTYFTWRNTPAELRDYVTELTTTAPRDFFRPHFFVNTPDINPEFLHNSGRAGFLIRAALAATLSGLWGVYNGFELCEARPLAPGKEDYLDSEKYEIRAWEWDRPGNIVADITRLNHLRRTNPALQSHLGVTFLPASNRTVLYYEKATPDRSNVILVAVSFDPFQTQESGIELPLWRWSLPDQAALEAQDLTTDQRFTWYGKQQRITLTPDAPYRIWRVRPA